MVVPVMDNTPEGLDTVGTLNAVWADTSKQVKHAMEITQVGQVRVDLRDEAKGRATSFAHQLSLRDGRSDPGWLSTHLRGSELRLGD